MQERNRFTYIAIGLGLGLLLALLFLVWAVPEFRDPGYLTPHESFQPNLPQNPAQQEDTNEPKWWYWASRLTSMEDTLAQWVMAFFTVIATGVSLFAVVLAYRSLRLTRDAVKINRELGQIQVRAFVTVGDISVEKFGVGLRPKIHLKIKNTGQSPANRFQFVTTYRVVDRIDAANHNFEGEKWRGVVIDLNPGLSTSQVTVLPLMTPQQYELFTKKEVFLVFYGVAKYRTVFGKLCRIVFCNYLNVDDLIRQGANLVPTVKHNRGS